MAESKKKKVKNAVSCERGTKRTFSEFLNLGVSGNVSRARSPMKRCFRQNSIRFSNSNLAEMGKMTNESMTHII